MAPTSSLAGFDFAPRIAAGRLQIDDDDDIALRNGQCQRYGRRTRVVDVVIADTVEHVTDWQLFVGQCPVCKGIERHGSKVLGDEFFKGFGIILLRQPESVPQKAMSNAQSPLGSKGPAGVGSKFCVEGQSRGRRAERPAPEK